MTNKITHEIKPKLKEFQGHAELINITEIKQTFKEYKVIVRWTGINNRPAARRATAKVLQDLGYKVLQQTINNVQENNFDVDITIKP